MVFTRDPRPLVKYVYLHEVIEDDRVCTSDIVLYLYNDIQQDLLDLFFTCPDSISVYPVQVVL